MILALRTRTMPARVPGRGREDYAVGGVCCRKHFQLTSEQSDKREVFPPGEGVLRFGDVDMNADMWLFFLGNPLYGHNTFRCDITPSLNPAAAHPIPQV